jgi:hypothetical protein
MCKLTSSSSEITLPPVSERDKQFDRPVACKKTGRKAELAYQPLKTSLTSVFTIPALAPECCGKRATPVFTPTFTRSRFMPETLWIH